MGNSEKSKKQAFENKKGFYMHCSNLGNRISPGGGFLYKYKKLYS